MTDLTPRQLEALRAVPELPDDLFATKDADVAELDALASLGLVRCLTFMRGRGRGYGVYYSRTPAGTSAVEESEP